MKEHKKLRLKTWHWIAMITAAILLVTSLAIGIWWAAMDVESFSEGWTLIKNLVDPPANDIYYKASYSVSDRKSIKWADKVVATVGGRELTNGQLQVYYWMEVFSYLNYNGYYALGQGLDLAKPLDEQACPDFEGTWQQYFLDAALKSWHREQALALSAEAKGITLSAEEEADLKQLQTELAVTAVKEGFSSVEAMLQHDMGAGCDFNDYYTYRRTYYLANAWFSQQSEAYLESIGPKEIEAYFREHQDELSQKGISKGSGLYYDVRHILIRPEGGTEDSEGNITYTEDQWTACEEEAQQLLDGWLQDGGTEAKFAEYANNYSADTGSNTSGGLYENLTAGEDILEEFVAWYTASGRQAGDYGLIKTSQGYHIMYLSSAEPQWEAASREGLLKEGSDALVQQAKDTYPMEVTYKNIVLSVIDLNDVL